MIFTGYIDESDTHGSTPDVTMSAMLGSAEQWQQFSRGLRRLEREYGFKGFHSVEFKGWTGQFEDWSWEKCQALMREVGKLTGDSLTEAISVSLKYAVYKEHFLDVRPPKMPRTSQYGLCFLAALDGLSKHVLERGRQHRLSVVIESGHKNAAETAGLFEERKAEYQKAGFDFLRSHTLATKNESPPLMISDIVAHGTAMDSRAIKMGDRPDFKDRSMTPPKAKEIGFTIMEVTPESLQLKITEYLAEREAARQAYISRKQEWLSSKKASEP